MRDTIGRSIALALAGRKVGGNWMARCPAHHDREPSLSICDADDGKILVHCHAGCDQKQVIAILRSRGLWPENGAHPPKLSGLCAAGTSQSVRDDAKRSEAALTIWNAAMPANGTLVEAYFASRGLYLPPTSALRLHAGLKHPSGGIWPAMVALVTHGFGNTPLAILRTFLACDGWQGAGRSAEDDARAMPWRRSAARPRRRCADGWRRHRDLPGRHAGDRPSGLGGTLNLRAANPRSAARRPRCDRSCRWG